MKREQHDQLLFQLKALADEHRLTIVQLMSGTERTVGELAGLLDLSEPTVSHHISKLRLAGLLNLRMEGTQRFYGLHPGGIARLKANLGQIDTPPIIEAEPEPDNRWIEALDWPEADKKVLRDHTSDGKLVRIPIKEKPWLVLLRWLADRFERDTRYTEKQVNAILSDVHSDYALLRRNLVEYGFMRRERGGGDYWLTPDQDT